MKRFAPREFFDIDAFAHPALFANNIEHVWQIVASIGPYLQKSRYNGIHGIIDPGAYIRTDCLFVAENARVEAGALIQGAAYIGQNSIVRHGAYLRGDVIIGKSCIVGHGTEVKNAVLMDGAHAAHFSYVGDSIVGRDVLLGAGVKLANMRLDRGTIQIRTGSLCIDTRLTALGAIVGDGTRIGCNSVLNPGTLLGKQCIALPLSRIQGVYAIGSKIGA